jgi:putative FmdB family regulatory protein
MPSYSYTCQACGCRFLKRFSFAEYEKANVKCPKCGSDEIHRRIGRVRMLRSTESRLEAFDDPGTLAGLEEDPRRMARVMREMGDELGEDIGPEFDEVVDRLESGQSPEEIEKEVPDLGGDGNGDDF